MTKIIPIEIYSRDVMVHFGSRKKLRKELSKHFTKDDADSISENFAEVSLGKTVILSGGQLILFMPQPPKSIADYAVLQHEIFHVAFFVLEKAGIILNDTCDEAYSYLIQFLTKRILQEFNLSFSCDAPSA